MGFNNDRPWQSAMLFEQALIQAKIPFDIVFNENLRDLSKYRVLVLADQECLNDNQLELMRRFVQQGGYVALAYRGGDGHLVYYAHRTQYSRLGVMR